MATMAYNDGSQWQQPTTVAAAAYVDNIRQPKLKGECRALMALGIEVNDDKNVRPHALPGLLWCQPGIALSKVAGCGVPRNLLNSAN